MPFSLEAEEAARDGRYARALRRLVKRRRAIAQASPYAVAILGVADAFGLYGGTVCYVLEDRPQRWLRILDLQAAPDHEIVVDVPGLVRAAVPGTKGGLDDDDYAFQLVHHAHGITSCLYSSARAGTAEQQQQQQHWLLMFDARANRVRGAVRLESAARLFVRNTAEMLYFGTHSEPGADGFRRWVVRCFDLGAGRLLSRRIYLSKVAGHELGATVCFELVDGYFYGVTNATTFEPEEIDWTSYYYCFRFRVASDPDRDGVRVEVMREHDSWRRQHDEGPIDDRWTSLRLQKDEATGRLRIVESRREWLGGTSHSRRTCYATDVVFPSADEVKTGGEAAGESGRPGSGSGGYSLPDVPLAGLLESDDKPNYMPAPARLPHNVHVGDEGAAPFLCGQTYLRSYFYASGTFLDLVDDPAPAAPYTQRLRLRALTRTGAAAAPNVASLAPGRLTPGVEPEKEPNIISMWPPAGPGANNNDVVDYDARLADVLQRTMNPENLCGAVQAVNDDRSLVYETGAAGEPKALVYISFDPAVRLAGMDYGGSLPGELIREEADGEGIEPPAAAVDPKGKGKGKGKATVGRAYMAPVTAAASTGNSTPTTTTARGDDDDDDAGAFVSAAAAGPACQQESPAPILTAAGAGPTWRKVDKAFHRELLLRKYTFGL